MKRKWALLPILLLLIIILSEIWHSLANPEDPKEAAEIIIKTAPSRH